MKKLLIASLAAIISCCAQASPALEQFQKAPLILCADHPNQHECSDAVAALTVAVYNITVLNESCSRTSDVAREKMDSTLKAQCARAKEITDYIEKESKTLQ